MTLLKGLFWKLGGGRKKCIFWQNMYYNVLNTEKVKPNLTKQIQKLKVKWVLKLPMGGHNQNWFIGSWSTPILGCPRLWQIKKKYLHNEGIYKWFNCRPIFFWYQLLRKLEFLKLIVLLSHYFWCQIWDQWHKLSGNKHLYIFFYLWFKNKRV